MEYVTISPTDEFSRQLAAAWKGNIMEIKAVVFEMDGVLFDTQRPLTNFWIQAAKEHGYEMKREQALQLRNLSKLACEEQIKKWFGSRVPFGKISRRRMDLMEEYIQENGLTKKPYLDLLLKYIDTQGYKKAIATSADYERTVTYLEMAGIKDRFDVLSCGSCVTFGKPSPDIYLYTARKLKVEPKHCLAIEESPTGLYAADSAGAHAVAIPDLTYPKKKLFNDDVIYRKCRDLLGVIGILDCVQYEILR